MIKTNVREHGFEGQLFPGDGRRDKVMIVMSGSNGGMGLTRQEAAFYHRHGIPALALALFATKGTQPFLDRVPVEYVERAIAWLKAQGYRRIGIDGMSKGSEMALTAAAMFDDLSCVIARVPSHFVSEGLVGRGKGKAPSGTSCWSWRGEALPYAPYRSRTFNIAQMLLTEKQMCLLPFNRDKDVTPESLIPIERIKAPVLLLSSVQDTVWPSGESGAYIENRLTALQFAYPHKHVVYAHMSHAMVTRLPLIYRLAFAAERREAAGCAADRAAMRQELLDWANEVWR